MDTEENSCDFDDIPLAQLYPGATLLRADNEVLSQPSKKFKAGLSGVVHDILTTVSGVE